MNCMEDIILLGCGEVGNFTKSGFIQLFFLLATRYLKCSALAGAASVGPHFPRAVIFTFAYILATDNKVVADHVQP